MDRRRRRNTPDASDAAPTDASSQAGATSRSSPAPPPLTPAIAAELTALAQRVQRIERIVQIRGAFERHSAATGGRIMMRQGGAKTTIDFIGDTKLVIVVTFHIEGDLDKSPEHATTTPVAEGQRVSASPNTEHLVDIDATYVIIYELATMSATQTAQSQPPPQQSSPTFAPTQAPSPTPAPTGPPSRDAVDHFARRNAVFNVMPFWREFVATAMSRAGLPPVMVPPMKTGSGGAKSAVQGAQTPPSTPAQ